MTQRTRPKTKNPACPRCRSLEVVPILRGMPTPEAEALAERGELVIGGCCIMGDGTDPEWHCNECDEEFK